ncbi:hypothetical protein ABZT49_06025 [Methylobacterium sp. EM32]|uniref:hypothetical protein n=1 Tax=Methylobacterium sp. EM32 TaxID=3163481 RepID=UPI0033ACEC24
MSASHNTQQPALKKELDDIDSRLSAAQRHAGKARKHEDAFWSRVYAALHDIYEVWQPLINNDDLIRAYCDRHGLKCNSIKLNNRFYAPVQLCFKNARSATAVTQYATTLLEADRLGKAPVDLVGWIKSLGSPSDVYDSVRSATKGPALGSGHVPVTAPQPAMNITASSGGASPTASANLPASTHAPAAVLLPQQTIISNIVQGWATIKRLVDGKEKRGSGADKRKILIRNMSVGGETLLCLENIDTAYTFTTARVTLPFAWAELGDRWYTLSFREADRLAFNFPMTSGWNATIAVDQLEFSASNGVRVVAQVFNDMDTDFQYMAAPVGYGPHLQLTAERATSFLKWHNIVAGSIKVKARQLRQDIRHQIDRHQAVLSNLWRQNREVTYGARTIMRVPSTNKHLDHRSYEYQMPGKVEIPRALDLSSDSFTYKIPLQSNSSRNNDKEKIVTEYHIDVHHFATSVLPFDSRADNMKCRLFDAVGPVPIDQDVRLPVLEMAGLCKLLKAHNVGAKAQFVDTDDRQAALLVEFATPDSRVRYMMPTVKSASMLRRHACEPLSKTASGNALNVVGAEAQFCAYITSYRSPDPAKWQLRSANFLEQLNWWMEKTNVSIAILLSGWSQNDIDSFNVQGNGVFDELKSRFGDAAIREVEGRPLITNRIECLEWFYSSTYDWGIMMDDDAILETKYHKSDDITFFDEMAAKGPSAYAGVDIFFPYWDGKDPRHPAAFWNKAGRNYDINHIFHKNPDLKGSLFVLRNFRKEGRLEVFPNPTYDIHGEDTLLATEAMSLGYTVMMCANIVLLELDGPSYFDEDRRKNMRAAHVRISEMYKHFGLRMKDPADPENKSFDRSEFYDRCWDQPKEQTVSKP